MKKLDNLHFHFHMFSGWGTSQEPKLIQFFLNHILYNYYSKKKNCGAFFSKMMLKKNGISYFIF